MLSLVVNCRESEYCFFFSGIRLVAFFVFFFSSCLSHEMFTCLLQTVKRGWVEYGGSEKEMEDISFWRRNQ